MYGFNGVAADDICESNRSTSGVMSSSNPTSLVGMQFVHTFWASRFGADPSAFISVHSSKGSFFWHGSSSACHSALRES